MNTARSPAPAASLFNIGPKNNVFAQAANTVGNTVTQAANTVGNTVIQAANTMGNVMTNAANVMTNTVSSTSKMPSTSQIVIISMVLVLIIFIGVFWKQIEHGFRELYYKIRSVFVKDEMPGETKDGEDVTQTPDAPQDDTVQERRLVEKILPGRQQVFNISKNNYTYYDAEPLCKALGSELATYEQVKQSYADGADWCNYGWVKGQMAVYPTQTDTWQQLQEGSEDQRDACGRPGVNGGFFDNPELRFGVNCYGIKPAQSEHDAAEIAAGEGAPLSPGQLEFEKKINKYRGEANNIGILPFNKQQWSN